MNKTIIRALIGLAVLATIGVSCFTIAIKSGIKSYHEEKRAECIEYGKMTNKEVKFSDTNTCWVKKNDTWEIK